MFHEVVNTGAFIYVLKAQTYILNEHFMCVSWCKPPYGSGSNICDHDQWCILKIQFLVKV